MSQIIHIGLDVHKDSIAVAMLRPDTTEVDERVAPNIPAAIRKLLSRRDRPQDRPAAHPQLPAALLREVVRVYPLDFIADHRAYAKVLIDVVIMMPFLAR